MPCDMITRFRCVCVKIDVSEIFRVLGNTHSMLHSTHCPQMVHRRCTKTNVHRHCENSTIRWWRSRQQQQQQRWPRRYRRRRNAIFQMNCVYRSLIRWKRAYVCIVDWMHVCVSLTLVPSSLSLLFFCLPMRCDLIIYTFLFLHYWTANMENMKIIQKWATTNFDCNSSSAIFAADVFLVPNCVAVEIMPFYYPSNAHIHMFKTLITSRRLSLCSFNIFIAQ